MKIKIFYYVYLSKILLQLFNICFLSTIRTEKKLKFE